MYVALEATAYITNVSQPWFNKTYRKFTDASIKLSIGQPLETCWSQSDGVTTASEKKCLRNSIAPHLVSL